ncbi:unnamed protein product [Closterium sp. NIES-53]
MDVGCYLGGWGSYLSCTEHTEATTTEEQQQEEEEAEGQGAYDPLSEADKEEAEVLMYCTGGIRCDVYSALHVCSSPTGRLNNPSPACQPSPTRFQEHTEATTAEQQQQQLQQQQQQEEEEAGRQEGAYDPLSEADKEETEVLMYCTGGIRCDVYSALLRQQGFKRLYTLEGGVARYMREQGGEHWNGRLFVFDSRLAVPPRDYQVGGKVLRAAEEEGVERIGEVLGEVMMGEEVGEEEESVGCQRCGGRLEEVKHRNCANSDCNALILFCSKCAQAMNGACSTECAAAPRLRPFLVRPEPYQRLHTYLPSAAPPRPPGYVSRRALKRRARKARRLAAAEAGEGQGAGEGREVDQETGRGREVEAAA